MSGLKQGLAVWESVSDRLFEMRDLDVAQIADTRGIYIADKIVSNSNTERDYGSLTLYRCMLLSPIDNALHIGTFNFADTSRILRSVHNDLSLSNVLIRGSHADLKNVDMENVKITSSLLEDCTFRLCRLRDCDFRGSRFKNVNFMGTKLFNCNFEQCKFENCVFEDAYEDDVWLDNTEIDSDCNFKHTKFTRCKLWWFIYDVDLEERDIIFEGTDLSRPYLPSIM